MFRKQEEQSRNCQETSGCQVKSSVSIWGHKVRPRTSHDQCVGASVSRPPGSAGCVAAKLLFNGR